MHCIITGGADGIGRAVVEHYAAMGAAVTIVDRDRERAEALCEALRPHGANMRFVYADLADPVSLTSALTHLATLPPADVVVQSAGISAVGSFQTSNIAEQRRVLDINLRAPMHLTAGLLRAGRINSGGSIVFLASLSVFTSYPGASGYAASKDGLAAYARSLRAALHKQRINVLTVYPGPTRTAHARRYSPDNRRENRRMPPEALAKRIVAAVEQRQTTLIPGAANRLIATIGRVAPRVTEWLMRKTLFEKMG